MTHDSANKTALSEQGHGPAGFLIWHSSALVGNGQISAIRDLFNRLPDNKKAFVVSYAAPDLIKNGHAGIALEMLETIRACQENAHVLNREDLEVITRVLKRSGPEAVQQGLAAEVVRMVEFLRGELPIQEHLPMVGCLGVVLAQNGQAEWLAQFTQSLATREMQQHVLHDDMRQALIENGQKSAVFRIEQSWAQKKGPQMFL